MPLRQHLGLILPLGSNANALLSVAAPARLSRGGSRYIEPAVLRRAQWAEYRRTPAADYNSELSQEEMNAIIKTARQIWADAHRDWTPGGDGETCGPALWPRQLHSRTHCGCASPLACS